MAAKDLWRQSLERYTSIFTGYIYNFIFRTIIIWTQGYKVQHKRSIRGLLGFYLQLSFSHQNDRMPSKDAKFAKEGIEIVYRQDISFLRDHSSTLFHAHREPL